MREETYTVVWKNYDGSILETDYDVKAGSRPTYDGATPIKPSSDGYDYTFIGWSPSVSNVYEDKTYVAQYESTLVIPFDGEGTMGNPYKITTADQLLSISNFPNACFELSNDITLNGNNSISPLFTNERPFNGFFDGKGRTIENVYIYNTDTNFTGLFASIGGGGTVKNLKLKNARISGATYVGGIAGISSGAITDCEVSGSVTLVSSYNSNQSYVGGIVGRLEGNLNNCKASTEVRATGGSSTCNIGGLAGYSNGSKTISNSSSTGKITASNGANYVYIGGLIGAGTSGTTIKNCYSASAIEANSYVTYIGGIMGHGNSTISTSYNTGNITVISDYDVYVGGLVGYGSKVSNSYNAGAITATGSGRARVGGIAGEGNMQLSKCYWLASDAKNAVGYDSEIGTSNNDGATKCTSVSDFYNLADALNSGLSQLAFEHKTSSSLPTLIGVV